MGRTPAGLTREKVYRFMRRRLLEGRPPTVREVRDHLGFKAVQTAREHLERLVEEGRLTKQPGRSRGYRLPGPELVTTLVPVLGRVPAGPLDLAVEDLEGYVTIEQRRMTGQSGMVGQSGVVGQGGMVGQSGTATGEGELFGLWVRGDSMRGAGILDGDLAIVRKQATARSGEIVVALVGDEATVKRLRRRNQRVELHPANPDYSPIVPDPHELGHEFRLLGKVIEIRRSLA